jgi:iron complex outermembrane receptor protein
VQDELTLVERQLRLILGSKFEYNSYTRFEFQPNVRLVWTPHEQHTVWTAVSRAVRTPSRFEHTIRGNFLVAPPLTPTCPVPFPCQTAALGDRGFGSEDLLAYELGYRTQLTPRLSLDIALFYHDYKNLRTFEPGDTFLELTPLPPHLVIPARVNNKMDGEAYGLELASQWNLTDSWRLSLGYTFLKVQLEPDKSSRDFTSKAVAGDSPQNQFHLRSFLDLPYNLKFDAALYYTDGVSNQDVPAYTRIDVRWGWHPAKNLELSIAGQNVFDRRHREFGAGFLQNPTRIERSVYGKVTWRF